MTASLVGREIKAIQGLDGWRERSYEAPGWTKPPNNTQKKDLFYTTNSSKLSTFVRLQIRNAGL